MQENLEEKLSIRAKAGSVMFEIECAPEEEPVHPTESEKEAAFAEQMKNILEDSNEREPRTIPEVVKRTVMNFGGRTALISSSNEISSITYNELDNKATAFAIALMDRCSVVKGDHIAMIMDNSPDWMISNIGIQYSGAVDVPRASDTPTEILANIVNHSDSRIALVQNESLIPRLPDSGKALDYIIVMDKEFSKSVDKILSYSELMEYGEKMLPVKKYDVFERIGSLSGEDLASIIYSSGTTGEPKGAMLTHSNYMHNIKYIAKGFGFDENDRLISVLPIWHAYERQAEYALVGFGGSIYYSNVMKLRKDLQMAEQTVATMIPRILSLFYKGFMNKAAASPVKKILASALISGAKKYDRARRILENEEPEYNEIPEHEKSARMRNARIQKALYSPVKKIADKILFSKLKDALGEKTGTIITGAGPLPSEIDEFFSAAGLKISEGYGMTETIVVDFVRDHAHNKIFTVGKILPELEYRIVREDGAEAKPGEIGLLKIKGPNVMKGYYRNPELTSKVIDSEGFLSTGDLVKKTIDDYIKIIGRNDDTFVLTTGEKVNPALIENELESDVGIDRAVLVGQHKPYVTAVIYPNRQALVAFAKSHSIKYSREDELLENPAVKKHVFGIVSKITGNNAKFAGYERVKDILLSFSEVTELSQSLKLKRNEYYSNHREEIEPMYTKVV
jgi:long-chain acyl-CoA synthetase